MPPLITLLTDFGTQDSYVGILKGVIAGICPEVLVIDLTHEVPPQDVAAARFNVMNAYLYFPATTIHVVVVDPGVGSTRRAIAVQTPHGGFVAPDNGVLSGVLERYESGQVQIVELTNLDLWRSPFPSATFHGRDIFAPVAAHWAAGRSIHTLGEPLALEDLVLFNRPPLTETSTEIRGHVQYCDRFGNLITTIPAEALNGKNWAIEVGERTIPHASAYSEVPPGEALALMGSHGWIEIAVNQGNAQAMLGLGVDSEIWGTFT
jgi:S-adenosyl-L-methionine hydrolase (adenosine-forming)